MTSLGYPIGHKPRRGGSLTHRHLLLGSSQHRKGLLLSFSLMQYHAPGVPNSPSLSSSPPSPSPFLASTDSFHTLNGMSLLCSGSNRVSNTQIQAKGPPLPAPPMLCDLGGSFFSGLVLVLDEFRTIAIALVQDGNGKINKTAPPGM